MSVAIVFDAPGRFSTMNGWPKTAWYFSASMRAMMSVPPPGDAPTMMRTGLDGQAWASARVEAAASTSPAARRARPYIVWGSSRGSSKRVPYGPLAVQRPRARRPLPQSFPDCGLRFRPMPGSPAATPGFGRLRVKLFLAIAGANAVLAAIAYLVFSASFHRGLAETLGRGDQARPDAFPASLAEGYGRERGWAWLSGDRDRWIDLSREALGLPRRPPGAEGVPLPAASPRELPLTVSSRLLLFDADRKLLAGPPELVERAVLRPIVRQGAVVGYLGAVPLKERIESLERVVAEQQRLQFAAIALGMLGASLVLGAGLAHWLARRVRTLAQGAEALILGDYSVRVPDAGGDELARLARDFNTLAETLAVT